MTFDLYCRRWDDTCKRVSIET